MDRDSVTSPAIESLSLRVSESLAITPGRGIARLDPKDLIQLGAEIGDVLAIAGKRLTVARAMPARIEHRGLGAVQIDDITRANAKAGLNERVQIARIESSAARRVELRPIGDASGLNRTNSRAVVRLLEALPVVVGDRVRVMPFGSRILDFDVVDTDPQDAVVVSASTRVIIQGSETAREVVAGAAYKDIGGLHQEIRRIREIVELPLRCPRVFRHLGIAAPKGVLLHGPPGTGKTLLARAVAHETGVAFLSVSGPEIIQKFYGESEARLRGIFEQAAKNAPCIIFIDEIDAIAPRREHLQGEVEKRVVAQLLSLMDGLKPRRQVIVIAATNLPDALDPALRRPGRFDREIEIGVPDADARREILAIHTRAMPLTGDVALDALAAMTHGFVGADLEALCREAAMTSLRASIPDSDFATRRLPEEQISSLRVGMDHFRSALTEVFPSAMRDVRVEMPDVRWDDVGGVEAVKQQLREAVDWPLGVPDLLRRAGARPPKGILLYGPPGTGKTLLARALASQSGVNFISVKGPSLLTKYVGESERGIRDMFKRARQSAPCVLLFDEIDALAPARGGADDGHVAARVVAQMLTEMDGIEELEGVLVVGTTNRRDIVDPALLRPGRFDLLLEVALPDLAARTAIFRVHLKDKPTAGDVDAADLAARTPGYSGAAIAAACRRAALMAVRRCIDTDGASAADAEPQVSAADLLTAIAEVDAAG